MTNARDIADSNLNKLTVDTDTLVVDSANNNVGIGTSPSSKLDINISTNARGYFSSAIGEVGTGNFALQVVDATGAALKPLGFRAEDIRFATGASERMRIDSSGKVGIGTSSPSANADRLHVDSDATNSVLIEGVSTHQLYSYHDSGGSGWATGPNDAYGQLIYFRPSSSAISFYTATGNEDMRLESDGDLHVDGNVVAYSTTISDKRLKKNIQPIENALWKVNQINGCTFTYLKDDRKSAGLIAQDLEKVLPSAVIEDKAVFHGEEGETYKTVQYDQVIGLLVEAIKELNAKVERLENGSSS